MEYRNWLNGLFHIAQFWGLEYWKSHFHKATAVACALTDEEDVRFGGLKKNAIWHDRCEARLLALDNALSVICDKHGIEAESIRNLVEAEVYQSASTNIVADAEYQHQIQSQLESFICKLSKS